MKIALIPARAGSVRVKDKNIKLLGDMPLIAHTINAAIASLCYDRVIVVTDSAEYADIANKYGAEVPALRPTHTASSEAADITWVSWFHNLMLSENTVAQSYSILRPTSPFRTKNTFQRAFELFQSRPDIDTLRAVQRVSEHPGKMWVQKAGNIVPLLPFSGDQDFWHNSQTNTLPSVFVQNASFEILKPRNIETFGSITGSNIVGFETQAYEGFDINSPSDFAEAERIYAELSAKNVK